MRIIVLFQQPRDEGEDHPDDTPVEEVKASLRRSLQQVKAGQTRPISEQWERIDRFEILDDRTIAQPE